MNRSLGEKCTVNFEIFQCSGVMGMVNFEIGLVDFEICQCSGVMGTVNFEIGKVDFEIRQCSGVMCTVRQCDEPMLE